MSRHSRQRATNRGCRLLFLRKFVRLVQAAVLLATGTTGMAQSTKLSEEEHQAALDRHYPFVEQGSEPGRSIPHDTLPGRVWSGQMGWRTRHGPAVVRWDTGRPRRVELARYPDGPRGVAEHMLDHGWRRRDGRGWIYGSIEIGPDDVTFVDGVQPVYQPPPRTDVPNLESDLARDPAFLAAIMDDRFANAAYAVFNRSFYKGDDLRPWGGGDRAAARLLANLRGLGESYQDWFPHGGLVGVYPDDRPEREAWLRAQIEQLSRPFQLHDMLLHPSMPDAVRAEILRQIEADRPALEQRFAELRQSRQESLQVATRALAALDENIDVFQSLHDHLARLGWRVENADDRARLREQELRRAVEVLREIEVLEGRPAQTPGAWTEAIRRQPRGPIRLHESGSLDRMSADEREVAIGGARRRLRDLATSGRIDREQFDDFSKRLAQW